MKRITEAWTDKYKKSIDCSNPKGFSQKAHCAGRKKKLDEYRGNPYETERGGKSGPRMTRQRRHREEVFFHLISNGIKVSNQPSMVTQKGSSDTFAVPQNQVKKAEKMLDDYFKKAYVRKSGMRRDTYKIVAEDVNEKVYADSGLGKWFGSGGKGGAGGGGWDRYNTKGERIGKCGDGKPGEGKPKCLSKAKAAKLRAQGGKKAIANAVRRKKAQDPQTDRPGTGNKPINVSNRIKKEGNEMRSFKQFVNEGNKPNDPKKWAAAKAAAKKKFDVYPSAYANAWASKKYKSMGGTWRKA